LDSASGIPGLGPSIKPSYLAGGKVQEDILNFLNAWQTLIGALVGFGGVIVTLVYNAKVARDTDSLTRKREIESLCVAVQQELLEYKKALNEQIDALHGMESSGPPSDEQLIELHALIFRQVFDANIQRLGQLGPEQVRDTLQAYNRQQSLVLSLKAYSQSYRDHKAIHIKSDRMQEVVEHYEIASGYVSAAIRSLGGPDWKDPSPPVEQKDWEVDMDVVPLPRWVGKPQQQENDQRRI
jgi:hypothetical protein